MSDFNVFKIAIENNFDSNMKGKDLYTVEADKDYMWELYLNSFPEGTNPIFKERREYDCNCCKNFIRNFANVVTINNGKIISIWDLKVDNFFQTVTDKMSAYIKKQNIDNIYISSESKIGTDKSRIVENGSVIEWNHFHLKLDKKYVNKTNLSVDSIKSKRRQLKEVFKRGLDTITLDSIDTVIELIEQDSIYRGFEHLNAIKEFKKLKVKYDKSKAKDNFAWSCLSLNIDSILNIRNTSIGTLLVDISEDRDLNSAVKAFESIMAPSNYKRPKAIFTKKMIEAAELQINELGYSDSLNRRFAVPTDITVNNVIYANRSTKAKLENSIFDDLKDDVTETPKNFDKVKEMSMDKFISDVLPGSTSIELFLENNLESKLMSIIAPKDLDSKSMFKWNNNFSWAYNGDITDSQIKKSVELRGGDIKGALRFSLTWFNNDDLDAHCNIKNKGLHICYRNKIDRISGLNLDIDITNPSNHNYKDIVENIVFPTLDKIYKDTEISFSVNNYAARSQDNYGFAAEIEFDGVTYEFKYDKYIPNKKTINVATLKITKDNKLKFVDSLNSVVTEKEMWNLKTNKFHNVSMILDSPNYWDEQGVGNLHRFFILENCLNKENPRGFFNEFLNQELMQNKKVFEALGAKTKVNNSDEQLSGIGISSTNKETVILRVKGKTTRIIKVHN